VVTRQRTTFLDVACGLERQREPAAPLPRAKA
jgi:hypothetical protein